MSALNTGEWFHPSCWRASRPADDELQSHLSRGVSPPAETSLAADNCREYFLRLALLSNVPPPLKLIIAYNAQNGLFNALNDWAHKFFSPATYDCRLCFFTYGLTGMLRPWKAYLESVPYPTVFLHREEFRRAYPGLDIRLPVILVSIGERNETLLSAGEIEAVTDLPQLIAVTRARLSALEQELSAESREPRAMRNE